MDYGIIIDRPLRKVIIFKNLTMPKIVKGGTHELFENLLRYKISKNLKGAPLDTVKRFRKNLQASQK